jgi:hypothetical protein
MMARVARGGGSAKIYSRRHPNSNNLKDIFLIFIKRYKNILN